MENKPFISMDDEQQILDCLYRIRHTLNGMRKTKPSEVDTELALAEIDRELYLALGITETIAVRKVKA